MEKSSPEGGRVTGGRWHEQEGCWFVWLTEEGEGRGVLARWMLEEREAVGD